MSTRRIATSSSFAMLILIMWVLQIWVFCHSQVTATRILPPPPPRTADTTLTGAGKDSSNGRYELLLKYFKDRALIDPHRHRHRRHGQGFEDSKRKIPSCPDPLHN